jgi:serine/threonine protein kinase
MTQQPKQSNIFKSQIPILLQAFARKIIGTSSNVEDQTIIVANEIRLFEKLKALGIGQNVVFALQHGWIDQDHFYLDMELCVLILNDFIRSCPQDISTSSTFWNFSEGQDPLGCFSLLGIIRQITQGLGFIHSKGEIHRDLKPHNGKALALMIIDR